MKYVINIDEDNPIHADDRETVYMDKDTGMTWTISNNGKKKMIPLERIGNDMSDLIDRQAAIDALGAICDRECVYSKAQRSTMCDACRLESAFDVIEELPSAQPEPSEITDEQAILHLQSTGWMQNHDREMYESGLRERLADDSGSYDSLVPCDDTISRQAAIDGGNT